MPIKFPRMHVAESAVNRILNVSEELRPRSVPAPEPVDLPMPEPRAPVVPDASLSGIQLDESLGAQTPELPPLEQTADPGATLQGDNLLDTLINPSE